MAKAVDTTKLQQPVSAEDEIDYSRVDYTGWPLDELRAELRAVNNRAANKQATLEGRGAYYQFKRTTPLLDGRTDTDMAVDYFPDGFSPRNDRYAVDSDPELMELDEVQTLLVADQQEIARIEAAIEGEGF